VGTVCRIKWWIRKRWVEEVCWFWASPSSKAKDGDGGFRLLKSRDALYDPEHVKYLQYILPEERKRQIKWKDNELEDALPWACNRLRKERPLVRSRETNQTTVRHDVTRVKEKRTIPMNPFLRMR
jgi:hypothetical protein